MASPSRRPALTTFDRSVPEADLDAVREIVNRLVRAELLRRVPGSPESLERRLQMPQVGDVLDFADGAWYGTLLFNELDVAAGSRRGRDALVSLARGLRRLTISAMLSRSASLANSPSGRSWTH